MIQERAVPLRDRIHLLQNFRKQFHVKPVHLNQIVFHTFVVLPVRESMM